MPIEKTVPPTGPRGGTTTRSKDGRLIRKAFWIEVDEAEALRTVAYEERRSETAIVRQLLRAGFGLDERDGEG